MLTRFLSAPLLIATLAIGLGAGIDALVKGVAPEAGLHFLLAWRFLFGALIALGVFIWLKRPVPKWPAIRFHTARGLLQLASAFLFFYALTQLRLAEATTIGFTAALMVAPVARILLGEKISAASVIATMIGFAGVILAVSGAPEELITANNRPLGLAACFAAAFLYAFVLVLLRMRAKSEDATTIALFTNGIPALAMLPVTVGLFGFPDAHDMPWFMLLGMLGYSVWYLMTLAYARAPAQKLAPIEYTALLWTALLGFAFFDEVPGWQLWAGAVIIIAACLYVAVEDRFKTRKLAQMPASDLPE